jgi:hypothetical protein
VLWVLLLQVFDDFVAVRQNKVALHDDRDLAARLVQQPGVGMK